MSPVAWVWWAPFVAAVLHIFEEFVYPGGFADWDRKYRSGIRASITPRFHLIINAALLLMCVQIGVLNGLEQTPEYLFAVAAWLAVAALFFSNAVFHVVGSIRTKSRSPGVITAVMLYLPMAIIGYWYFLDTGGVSVLAAVIAALVGGSYHFWSSIIHALRSR